MRQMVFLAMVSTAALLAGCVTSSDPFQTQSAPINMEQVTAELEAVFTYAAGFSPTRPELSPPPGDNPEVKPVRAYELADELHAQLAEAAPYLDGGCLGENNRGQLELRDCTLIGDQEQRNATQQVLAAINRNRKSLYYELALFYHHSKLPISAMESTAATTHTKHSPGGRWVQMPPMGLAFDRFIKTPYGAGLGDLAVADAWLQVP